MEPTDCWFRCYRTFMLVRMLGTYNCWWVEGYHHAWCYWHYLRCNSGDLASTSSQMCGSWNLPMFLLRDGSFTLMKIASLMFLAILLSSLPTILKLSRETSWPVVFCWSMMGDGALMCSLCLSPNVLPYSPMYSMVLQPGQKPHCVSDRFCSEMLVTRWLRMTWAKIFPVVDWTQMPQ